MLLETARDATPYELFTGRGWSRAWSLETDELGTAEDVSDVTAVEISARRRTPSGAAVGAAVSWTTANGKVSRSGNLVTLTLADSDTAALTVGLYDMQIWLTRTGGADDQVAVLLLQVSEGL
jgi:hypothetical protein